MTWRIRDEFGTIVEILSPCYPEIRMFYPDWAEILRRDPCSYCGSIGGTVDHIIPKACGGETATTTNGVGACADCNVKKSNRSLLEFLMIKKSNGTVRHGFFSENQIEQMKKAIK